MDHQNPKHHGIINGDTLVQEARTPKAHDATGDISATITIPEFSPLVKKREIARFDIAALPGIDNKKGDRPILCIPHAVKRATSGYLTASYRLRSDCTAAGAECQDAAAFHAAERTRQAGLSLEGKLSPQATDEVLHAPTASAAPSRRDNHDVYHGVNADAA